MYDQPFFFCLLVCLRQSIYELLILRPTAEASDDIGALTYTVIFSLMERYAAFNPVTNAPTYYQEFLSSYNDQLSPKECRYKRELITFDVNALEDRSYLSSFIRALLVFQKSSTFTNIWQQLVRLLYENRFYTWSRLPDY